MIESISESDWLEHLGTDGLIEVIYDRFDPNHLCTLTIEISSVAIYICWHNGDDDHEFCKDITAQDMHSGLMQLYRELENDRKD